MNRKKAAAIFALILSASMITTACGSTADTPETTSDTVGTTAKTVPINSCFGTAGKGKRGCRQSYGRA